MSVAIAIEDAPPPSRLRRVPATPIRRNPTIVIGAAMLLALVVTSPCSRR